MKTCIGRIFPNLFFKKERIIRIIYSPRNINPNTKNLKANFIQFRLGKSSEKHELSCNRFEIDTLINCRRRGKENSDSTFKRNFYGYGCTSVALIRLDDNYSLKYTPNFPDNHSHCDIYHDVVNDLQSGEANPAEINYQKEIFLKKWKAYEDSVILKETDILPLNSS